MEGIWTDQCNILRKERSVDVCDKQGSNNVLRQFASVRTPDGHMIGLYEPATVSTPPAE
jgi:hypothetical protein